MAQQKLEQQQVADPKADPKFDQSRRDALKKLAMLFGAGYALACTCSNSVFGIRLGPETKGVAAGTASPEPSATAGLLPGAVEIAEIVKNIQPTSWDADKSLPNPENLNTSAMKTWHENLANLISKGEAKPEDIRTYTYLNEILGGDSEAWETPTLAGAIQKRKGNMTGDIAWVASHNGQFVEARNIDEEFWFQARVIAAFYPGVSEQQVFDQLRRLVGLEGYMKSERLATENTFPQGADTRRDQKEDTICSRYDESVRERGQEYKDVRGELHLSNRAQFAVAFRMSDTEIEIADPKVPFIHFTLNGPNIQGQEGVKHVYVRIADLTSQPQVMGVVPEGVTPPNGPGCGSIVGPNCELAQPVPTQEVQAAQSSGQGGGQPESVPQQPQPSQQPPIESPAPSKVPEKTPENTPPGATDTPIPQASSTPNVPTQVPPQPTAEIATQQPVVNTPVQPRATNTQRP